MNSHVDANFRDICGSTPAGYRTSTETVALHQNAGHNYRAVVFVLSALHLIIGVILTFLALRSTFMTKKRRSRQFGIRRFTEEPVFLMALAARKSCPDFAVLTANHADVASGANKLAISTTITPSQTHGPTSFNKIRGLIYKNKSVNNYADFLRGIHIKKFPATIYSSQITHGEHVHITGREDAA